MKNLSGLHSFYENMRLNFAQNLRTIPASAEEQILRFSVKVVNKTAANAAQLAFKCNLRFTLIHIQLQLPAARTHIKTSYSLFNKLV